MIYPRHCPVCHRILKDDKRYICPPCEKKIRPLTGSLCMKCGRPVEENREYCRECLTAEHTYDRGRGIFLYNDMWKKSLERFKFYGCREYGDFYSHLMWEEAKEDIRDWNPDIVVPVPMHPKKQRMRGFNQSWYLAQRISRASGIPSKSDAVRKVRNTAAQKQLDAAERKSNLHGAFAAVQSMGGRCVLVVDDVYTTGSTIDAMASVLRDAGASAVFFLTCCIVPGPGE